MPQFRVFSPPFGISEAFCAFVSEVVGPLEMDSIDNASQQRSCSLEWNRKHNARPLRQTEPLPARNEVQPQVHSSRTGEISRGPAGTQESSMS